MKRIVAFAFFLLFLAAFAFVSLDGLQKKASEAMEESPGHPLDLVGTDWRLADTGGVVIEQQGGVYVRFEADGNVSGHAGCNGFFGSYTVDAASIGIGPLGATRKMCPQALMDIEYTFMNALQNARAFDIEGRELVLVDAQNRSMTLSATLDNRNNE